MRHMGPRGISTLDAAPLRNPGLRRARARKIKSTADFRIQPPGAVQIVTEAAAATVDAGAAAAAGTAVSKLLQGGTPS